MNDKLSKALQELRAGRMIVVTDDEDRENEGDLVMDARFADAAAINFMATHGRGLICMPMEAERLAALGLGPMVSSNQDPHGTAFTVSVDRADAGTGISAAERAATVAALINPSSTPATFRSPGHLFPLAAREGGTLARRGHTEAAVDLSRLAGASIPAGVICEIMSPDGTMARMPELRDFAARHGLVMLTVAELAEYRHTAQPLIRRLGQARLPTRYGNFTVYFYQEQGGAEHLALVKGEPWKDGTCLCRLHSECLTGDALGSSRCDCGEQYEAAMRAIEAEGSGVLVYLRQEGRGIGLVNKLRAYSLQDKGADTVDANLALGLPADARDYRAGADILKDLGISRVRLLSNNPAKSQALKAYGLAVDGFIPLRIRPNDYNRQYLLTKELRMGHSLGLNQRIQNKEMT